MEKEKEEGERGRVQEDDTLNRNEELCKEKDSHSA